MTYIIEYQKKFTDLKSHLDNKVQLLLQANGGNSILFSYPPEEEKLYIEKAKEIYADKALFIDVSKLLVQFIDEDGWESFKDYYRDFRSTPHLIFRSEDPAIDLFDLIIEKINEAYQIDKIPFLIRSGCLYGTGIENANIMENKVVMNQSVPLVIFYPSKIEDDNIYFLNFKLASKYRCILVR